MSAIVATSGNKANAVAVATLAAFPQETTHISGFEITACGAISSAAVTVTVTDGHWELNYTFVFPTGAITPATPLMVEFPQPIPASAPNTAITVTLPAGGSGNSSACVNAHGLHQ